MVERWNKFFFEEVSPLPLGIFRVLYGTMVVITLILLKPDWLNWFGTKAWVSLPTMAQLEPGTRLNIFAVLPQNDTWVEGVFWVALIAAILLAAGFLTRINSVLVFLFLTSIDQRNLFITHAGDTFLRVTGFFLMFAPAGAALSVDRLIWREGPEKIKPWAQRMMQFELSLLYFVAFLSKIQGEPWLSGTALQYVYHLDQLQRFPLPHWLLHPFLLRIGTWSALVVEFSLGVLIWVKKVRYYVLAAGVLFHMAIEYSLNIPLFEWEVLSAYILFVDAADIKRIWNWIRSRG